MTTFYFKCESREENTYTVDAGNREEAERLFNKGKATYVPGTNTIRVETVKDVFILDKDEVK